MRINNCWIDLVVFNSPIHENEPIILNDENVVEEFLDWEELEKWIEENNDVEEMYNLAFAIDELELDVDLIEGADYFVLFAIENIRTLDFNSEWKQFIEEELRKAIVCLTKELFKIDRDEGRLEKFKIYDLFGKFDAEIDMSDTVNILIGANGIGKTTIIKILDNYLHTNLVDILSVPFERIEYYFIKDVCDFESIRERIYMEIYYEDCLPKPEYLIDSFRKGIESGEITENQRERINIKRSGSISLVEAFEKMLNDLITTGTYGQFVYNTYRHIKPSLRVLSIVEKWIPYTLFEKNDFIEVKSINNAIAGTSITYFAGSVFEKKEMTVNGNNVCIPDFFNLDWTTYYIDLVRKIQIDGTLVMESQWFCKETNWLTQTDASDYIYRDMFQGKLFSSEAGYWFFGDADNHVKNDTALARARAYIDPMITKHTELYQELLLTEYTYYNVYSGYKGNIRKNNTINEFNVESIEKMSEEGILRINEMIYQNYYSDEFILEINNRQKKYIQKYLNERQIDTEKSFEELLKEYDDNVQCIKGQIARDYIDYVHPVLIRNSFFSIRMDILLNPLENNNQWQDTVYEEIVFLRNFLLYLEEILPLMKDEKNRSNKINTFEKILRKYMVDKYISIFPCGIRIMNSQRKRFDDQIFVLYDQDEMDVSMISSGEKKIISIFALQIFYNGVILLIDEPELSLSILWQESLLPDLIECGNNRFIIATHSPYIAKNEKIQEYITYLPQNN